MSNPITAIRNLRGISRTELAQRSGVSYQTLCALESGRVNSMHEKTAATIAKFAKSEPEQVKEQYSQWKQELLHA